MALVVRHVAGLIVFVVFASTGPAWAQGSSQPAEKKEPSVYDKIWRFATWYDSKENDVVQRVLFSGRLHYEFADVPAATRVARIGPEAMEGGLQAGDHAMLDFLVGVVTAVRRMPQV